MIAVQKKPNYGQEQLFVVSVGSKEIGFVTKFKNTKTDKHPWKAFVGIGVSAKFLGAYYEGKAAAVNAVALAA